MEKKRKKRDAYKHYIRLIFTDYERVFEDPELEQLTFTCLNEETQLTRDEHQRIHFTTRGLSSKQEIRQRSSDSTLPYQMERLVDRKKGYTKF